MKNTQAFPSMETNDTNSSFDPGMTLRDYFAAKAMQAHISNGVHYSSVAQLSYQTADAMLKAREL